MKNLPILYKLAIALGGIIGLSLLGFALTIGFIRESLKKQLANQSQAELGILALNFTDRLRQESGALNLLEFAPLIAQSQTKPAIRANLNQRLARVAQEQELDFVVLLDSDRKVIGANIDKPFGSAYDPKGLVTKAVVRGEMITSYEREELADLKQVLPQLTGERPSTLVRYDVEPINDRNDNPLGVWVRGNVIDSNETVIFDSTNRNIGGGFSLASLGTESIVLGSALENDLTVFLEDLPPEARSFSSVPPAPGIVAAWITAGGTRTSPIAPGTIVTEEVTFNNKPFTTSYAPILNTDGNPVGLLVRGTPQDNLDSLLQEVIRLVSYTAMGLSILAALVAFLVGRTIVVPIRRLQSIAKKYMDGDLSERADADSEDEIGTLASIFNQMSQSIQQRQADQIAARSEIEAQSMVLEEEVGKLLEVVSELESGDLTVEAEVSDQATGLVADTLNRLIEQLSNTVASVVRTALQVNRSAEALEELALTVAQNAQDQVHLVEQATQGMNNVNELAEGASQQALITGTALTSAQSAVAQGQAQVVELNASIQSLQSGTEEMVKRIKSLGEFVDLAKQFVQDQKRLASLTQVLAMNASMVAARALEQREPDQFATVAREFEAIAGQVNKLASQTSQGLALLQQRTGFIEIVVSGINQDVSDVSNLVSSFTASVEETNQAFLNIRTVTEEVAKLGQAVTESSQFIANAIKISFDSIKEIEAAAERSAEQSDITKQRSMEMGEIAKQLLDSMEFFRLPPEKQALLTGES